MLKKTFLAMVVATMGLGCGGDDGGGSANEGPPSAAKAMEYCEEGCAHEAMCDPANATPDCVSNCTQVMPAFRESAVVTLLECQTASCTVIDDTCFAMIEPAAYHTEYEAACTAKLTECGQDSVIPQICDIDGGGDAGFFLLFNEAVVTDFTACFQQPCDMIFDPCFGAVAMQHGLDF